MTEMYGVMVKNDIKLCASLKHAIAIRDDMIKSNEFSNYVIKHQGGYKIVKVQIEEVEE